jgi:hypothetical protein
MVGIFIYIDGVAYGIELFKDETISVTSSVQNFNEIGKIFTDYSKSFTIPASAHNNKIFKYWYENALDNGYDHRIKYYGYIEIDTLNFRYGKFQLEKANKNNGGIESYTIGFVGNLTQLKDRFKADKLNSLSYVSGADRISYYDELNFNYTAGNLFGLLTSMNPNVAFPLIGSDRRYECDTATGSDITTPSGTIDTRDLFPAIPVYKIFEYIQGAYGLTFIGVALDALFLKNLWLYCKTTEKFSSYPKSLKINWTSSSIGTNTTQGYLDITTDELIFKFNDLPYGPPDANIRLESWINIIPTDSTIEYSVEIYDNGILYTTYSNRFGTIDQCYFSVYRWDEPKVNGEYPLHKFSFKISSVVPMTFSSQIQYKRNYGETVGWNRFGGATSQSTTGYLTIQKYIPDITVEAFIVGIMKAFNLIIIPTNETTFEFVTMDVYYERGRIVDITDMCSSEVEEISKPNLFKSIKFIYEKSENILNNAFRGLFNRDYGDLIFDNSNLTSTETFEVKLPFENIMFENYTDTNFITATCWDKDTNAYLPKPVLLYDNGLEDLDVSGTITDINYSFGASNISDSKFRKFTNQLNIGATDPLYSYSLNFGDEFSVETSQDDVPKGLFTTYYAKYVQNLYSLKTRKVTIKAILTTYWATYLQLNDRVILNNKRYTINTTTINTQTKETTFELLSDFRELPTANTSLRNSNIQSIALNNTAQELELQIYLNDSDLWRSKVATGFLVGTYTSGGNVYKDGLLIVSVPANATGIDRADNVLIEYFKAGVSTTISINIFQNA